MDANQEICELIWPPGAVAQPQVHALLPFFFGSHEYILQPTYSAPSLAPPQYLIQPYPFAYQHLQRLPQFNFFRSPMCRVAGLQTCLALPISPGEQSEEVLGAVILFTCKEIEPSQEIVDPLMDKYVVVSVGWQGFVFSDNAYITATQGIWFCPECLSLTVNACFGRITMVAKLATAKAKQPKNLIPMHSFAGMVTDAIRQRCVCVVVSWSFRGAAYYPLHAASSAQ